MITPAEIAKKAERKYKAVLQAYLTGENLFPIEFPVGKVPLDLAKRRQYFDELRERSKEQMGNGYIIDWNKVNKRHLGQQTIPKRIIIETLHDYLALTRKCTQFDRFTADADKIRRHFPQSEEWIHANTKSILDNSGHWDDLLLVCDHFVKYPRPNLYIRELPIPVHTKFIEQHSRVLRDLLDTLLPDDTITPDTNDFSQRFGLKSPPPTMRIRLLEEQLDWQYGLRLDDLTLPIDQLAHLLTEHIQPKTVIIAENLMNFLTLPSHPASIGLFGRGFAVQLLADVRWLHQCRIIYWGDIDAHGFQILSDLRKLFPHVRSVMMDQQTMDDHAAYVVEGNRVGADRFDGLTDTEAIVAQHVQEHNLRLEQEHISQAYALIQLGQMLRFGDDSLT